MQADYADICIAGISCNGVSSYNKMREQLVEDWPLASLLPAGVQAAPWQAYLRTWQRNQQ